MVTIVKWFVIIVFFRMHCISSNWEVYSWSFSHYIMVHDIKLGSVKENRWIGYIKSFKAMLNYCNRRPGLTLDLNKPLFLLTVTSLLRCIDLIFFVFRKTLNWWRQKDSMICLIVLVIWKQVNGVLRANYWLTGRPNIRGTGFIIGNFWIWKQNLTLVIGHLFIFFIWNPKHYKEIFRPWLRGWSWGFPSDEYTQLHMEWLLHKGLHCLSEVIFKLL